jgi:hypothetical protein
VYIPISATETVDQLEEVDFELDCRTHLHKQNYEVKMTLKDFETHLLKKPIIDSGAKFTVIILYLLLRSMSSTDYLVHNHGQFRRIYK